MKIVDLRRTVDSSDGMTEWRAADGDNTFAIAWPINQASTVLEVGGYQGRWAAQMMERYNPFLYVFEPQPWAAEKCREHLKMWKKATVLTYGLGIQNAVLPMGEWGNDGCSFVHVGSREQGQGEMREAASALKALGIEHVDLCLINIEGYEYELLPHLKQKGVLNRIDRLMIQFHIFADETGEKYRAIRAEIEETHRVVWDFGTTLTAWERPNL